jgi:hypothetical protein
MRSKHNYQKRNSHLKVRQEKKKMNLTTRKRLLNIHTTVIQFFFYMIQLILIVYPRIREDDKNIDAYAHTSAHFLSSL